MICECGCHDRVVRTVSDGDSVTRVRRCIACGKTSETVETRVPSQTTKRAKGIKKADPHKDAEPAKDTELKGALQRALATAK